MVGRRWEWNECCGFIFCSRFNLSNPAVQEALYDSAGMRPFVGIDLEPVPDETTACKFRHLLEEHKFGEEILGAVNCKPEEYASLAAR